MQKTYKILVAEDNDLMLELLSTEIKDYLQGAELTLARDGTIAFGHATKVAYDLIVSDNVMPGKLGSTMLREIRDGEGPNQKTPFVFCSGNFSQDEIKGIRDCLLLPKPFDIKKLYNVLNKALQLEI